MASSVNRPSTAFSLDGRRSRERQPRVKAAGHLEWIRTLPSLVPGFGNVEAAHIRFGDPRYAKPKVGMAEKPDDKWVVPLSAEQHRAQHSMNERDYWAEAGIDPVLIALLLHAHSGNDEPARQIIAQARLISRQPIESETP